MANKIKPEPDDKEQSSRFVETAKSLEVDEIGKNFDRAMNLIAPSKSKPEPKPKKKSGPS